MLRVSRSRSIVDPSAAPPPGPLLLALAAPLLGVKPAIMPYFCARSESLGCARSSNARCSPSAAAATSPAQWARSQISADGRAGRRACIVVLCCSLTQNPPQVLQLRVSPLVAMHFAAVEQGQTADSCDDLRGAFGKLRRPSTRSGLTLHSRSDVRSPALLHSDSSAACKMAGGVRHV